MTRSRDAEDAIARSDQLEETGDLDGAILVLSEGIQNDPDEPLLRALRGRLFRIRKQWTEAIADFDAALALKPNAPTTLFFRGTSRAMTGDFEGAIADLEHCIRLQPESADAYWQLGIIHRFRGDLRRTIDAYARAFELDPEEYPGLENELVNLKHKLQQQAVDGQQLRSRETGNQ